jgi:hypothetical protein
VRLILNLFPKWKQKPYTVANADKKQKIRNKRADSSYCRQRRQENKKIRNKRADSLS